MTEIDWSKAPTNATHWSPTHAAWLRWVDSKWWAWEPTQAYWACLYDTPDAVGDDTVARPTPSDPVNHPEHYTAGSVECIDAIEAALTPEEFRGYCKGNALKYIWRERHKGGVESLKKAQWYLDKLISEQGE